MSKESECPEWAKSLIEGMFETNKILIGAIENLKGRQDNLEAKLAEKRETPQVKEASQEELDEVVKNLLR